MERSVLNLAMRFVILLGGGAIVVESATIDVELSESLAHVGDNVTFTCKVTGVGNETVILTKVIVRTDGTFDVEQIAIGDSLTQIYRDLKRFSVLNIIDSDTQVILLRIAGVQWEDSGNYTCAVPAVGDLYNMTMLEVYLAPTFVCGRNWNGTVNITDLRIICHVFADPPSPSQNKTVSIDQNRLAGLILVRDGDNITDYSHKVKNLLGASFNVAQMELLIKKVPEKPFNYSHYFPDLNPAAYFFKLPKAALVVHSQSPKMEVQLSNQVPHVGDNVTFTCKVTGIEKENIVLTKVIATSEELFVSEQIAIGDSLIGVYKNLGRISVLKTTDGGALVLILRITGVLWEDSGNYGCSVSADDLFELKMLEVYRKPTSVFFVNNAANSTVILRENERPSIICRVPDVLPIPKVQIFLDREKDITQDFMVTTEQNVMCSGTQSDKRCPLHLSYTVVATSRNFHVTSNDDGKTLTCVAKMKDLGQDELSSTIKLEVRYSPKFVCTEIWKGSVNMIDLRIICQVYANPLSPVNSKMVTIDTKTTSGLIVIRAGDNTANYSLENKVLLGSPVKATQMEFVIKTVSEQHLHYSYNFTAANELGSTSKVIRIEKSLTPVEDGAETNVSRLSLVAVSLIFAVLFGRL